MIMTIIDNVTRMLLYNTGNNSDGNINTLFSVDDTQELRRPDVTTANDDVAMSYEQHYNNFSVGFLKMLHSEASNNTLTTLAATAATRATEQITPALQQHQHFDLGPKRDSLQIVIPVTIIYSLIFITGVIGNISTCIVIKKNRSMHTATNYYLFSLAISDFLLLLSGVPQEMHFIWSKYPYVFGEYFCIGRGLLAETSANATVLTITAFTVERYVAICHPFLGQAMSKLSRALRIIILIWISSIVTAIPQAAQFGIVQIPNGIEKCDIVRHIIAHSFQLSTYIFFIAPMSIILILYLLIGLRLYRSNIICGSRSEAGPDATPAGVAMNMKNSVRLTRSSSSSSNRAAMKSTQSDTILYRLSSGGTQMTSVRGWGGRMNQYGTRRVLKMLVAVVICFFLCWAPFHAQRLIAVYGSNVMGGALDDSTTATTTSTEDEVLMNDSVIVNITAINEFNHSEHQRVHEVVYTVMTYVSGVLYYLSTCINPLLYNLMSNKFREAFKAILFRKKSKGSINSHRALESRRLRRNPTLTSSTQRETSESDLQLKHSSLQISMKDRKGTT